jgi:hypothetical protein
MLPAMAFKVAQRVQAMASIFDLIQAEPPEFHQRKDGRLVGAYQVFFDPDQGDGVVDSDQHPLVALLHLCRTLSEEFDVNWEFSHDYEIDPVGQIIDGVLDECLTEEIESIIQIGNLFGDIAMEDEFEEEENWEPRESQFGSWRHNIQISAATVQTDDEPRVLKFPGVE